MPHAEIVQAEVHAFALQAVHFRHQGIGNHHGGPFRNFQNKVYPLQMIAFEYITGFRKKAVFFHLLCRNVDGQEQIIF